MSSVNKRTLLLVIWIILLIGIYGAITHFNSKAAPPKPPQVTFPKLTSANMEAEWPQILAHIPDKPRGLSTAPFTIVECGDFQCPQCGKMRPVLEGLLKKYPDDVNMMFLERPFPQLHKWAVSAAQASLAAAAQGKFWPMYDILYSSQDNLEPGYYNGYAAQAGMNVPVFEKAMSSNQYLPEVNADKAFADALDIKVTPTVLVRNNKTGAVTIYVGSDSTLPGAIPDYLGIEQMAANPPWLVTKGQ
jgi:protein-disulfide isomerase